MKQLYNYIMLIIGMIAFCACTDENEFLTTEQEGEYVKITLPLKDMSRTDIDSRDVYEDNEETYIQEIDFFVFSGEKLVGYTKVSPNESVGYEKKEVTINAYTGDVYIYAVANAETEQYKVDSRIINITEDNYSSSELKRSAFLAMTFNRNSRALLPLDKYFVMTGFVNNGNPVTIVKNDNNVTITNPTSPENQIIKLYRVLAKNTISISSVKNNDKTPKFSLTSYQLHNIALKGNMIPNGTYTFKDENDTDENYVEDLAIVQTTGNVIEFYLPENMAGSGSNINDWKDREKNQYGEYGNKTFSNAPNQASYITIYGKFDDKDNKRYADVSYTIHFGDFSNTGSLNNFNVDRKYHYKYAIHIKDVNDIEVEAKKEMVNNNTPIDNPYAEGIVIDYTTGNNFVVDAHYEARVMRFSKNEIDLLKNTTDGSGNKKPSYGYIIRIKTPFGETLPSLNVKGDGIYDASNTLLAEINEDGTFTLKEGKSVFTKEADYNWVRFVKNIDGDTGTGCEIDDNHSYDKDVCKYPGDDNTINIFQLLSQLYSGTTDDIYTFNENDDNVAYYSCFIDENYYANKDWKDYVNHVGNRMMTIANNIEVSLDNKSLYADAKYSISQRPIWTVYNTNLGGDIKAFGIESVSEEEQCNFSFAYWDNGEEYTYDISSENQDNWYGYTAAKKYQNGKYFNVNNKHYEGIQDLYTKVSYACMSRNRDENGNGTIDADNNEIRWYLATTDQLRGLSIGNDILPEETQLASISDITELNKYKQENNKSNSEMNLYARKYHYYTASYTSIFWAEEVVSTSRYNQDRNWSDASNVRCVRTLENKKLGVSDPDKYYSTSPETPVAKSIFTINLDKIDPKALRTETEVMAVSHERSEQNRVYSQFTVRSTNIANNNYTYDETYDVNDIIGTSINNSWDNNTINTNQDVCKTKYGDGWRVPNQRELSLMLIIAENYGTGDTEKEKIGNFYSIGTSNGLWCNTYFSGTYNGAKCFKYLHAAENITMSDDNNSHKVRCVKDGYVESE